jgi:hypothetical protein
MTWTTFHHRGAILREVLATAERRRDGRLPMDVDGVRETFDDELDLIGALQLRWHTRLAGRIEHAMSAQPMDLEAAVAEAWRTTAEEMPGVRAVLDRYRDDPLDAAMDRALTRAAAKEHVLLAVMAGRAASSDALAPAIGAGIEDRARAAYLPGVGPRGPRQPRLRDRIRAALAA